MTIDYAYYTGRYNGGSIPYEDWAEYEARAKEILSRYKRVYTVSVTDDEPEGEQLAVCAMADALHTFDLIASGEAGPVKSASIGSVKTEYGSIGTAVDISPSGQAKELYRCASIYLDIYRGVC